MVKDRGFERITGSKANIPERKTAKSAGYDLEAIEETTLYPGEVTLIPTGLKAFMQDDEVLLLHIRSSCAIKRKLFLANSVGVIDADYYDNEDNEGHIMVPVFNANVVPQTVKKGERIAQAIFTKYLTADNDKTTATRKGGMGSTGK